MLTEADSVIAYSRSASGKPKGKSMTKELVFYTNPQSRGMIAHWMLEEVGAPYSSSQRLRNDDEGARRSCDQSHGQGAGHPALETVVTETAAICAYLADAFPEPGLAPEPEARGDYYRWLFFLPQLRRAAKSNHAAVWDPATPEMQARFGYGSYAAVMDALAKALARTSLYCGRQVHRRGRLCRVDDRLWAAIRRDRQAPGIRSLLERLGKSPRAAARRRRGGETGVEASLGGGVISGRGR